MRKTGIGTIAAVVAVSGLAATASATNLTFAIAVNPGTPISGAYGDNVTSTSDGAFGYGDEHGFTPNITVAYDAPQPPGSLIYANTGFGDLQRVGWANGDFMEITFTAEEGYFVQLHGFEMAGMGSDQMASMIQVVEGGRGALFSETDALTGGGVSEPRRTSWDFETPLFGEELTIQVTGISSSVAIDNIRFGQTDIPAPSALGCLAMGGVLAARRRR